MKDKISFKLNLIINENDPLIKFAFKNNRNQKLLNNTH